MEITSKAIQEINKVAPVWAAELAGRAKFFADDTVDTAYVTNAEEGMKIVVGSKWVNDPGFLFILMHEMAHVFREDLISMQNNQNESEKINVAADCIINDTLVKLGIKAPLGISMCFGQNTYGFDCSDKSINQLVNHEQKNQSQPSAPQNSGFDPGDASPSSSDSSSGNDQNNKSDTKNSQSHGESNPDGYIGLGKDPIMHTDIGALSRSVCKYARSAFFSKGFKSKNFSSKNDWRRNRSSFATRTDVRIPSTTFGESGNDREGPLVCLVLDTSGSMSKSWIATAAKIAEEIKNAGLEYDLWLTPSRRKAKDPDKVIWMLQNDMRNIGNVLEKESFPGYIDTYDLSAENITTNLGKRPSNAKLETRSGFYSNFGANELDAVGMFETDDPVVWIYIGDYHSKMRRRMFMDKNFLHVVMLGDGVTGATSRNVAIMRKQSLPRWEIKL